MDNYYNNENIQYIKKLIVNTENEKEKLLNQLNYLKNNFINEFNESGLEYELLPNLEYMRILFKGDIFESDFVKDLESQKIEFTLEELEKYIYDAEINNGENLDDLKLNIKLYKLLDDIEETEKDIKSILINTINIVLAENYEKENIIINKENILNKFNELLNNNMLDNIIYEYISSFLNYICED